MAYIIAIANEKGGVAKTTTTLSLGAALVEYGASVLLVDLDAQANLSLALGFQRDMMRFSIANMVMDSMPLRQIVLNTYLDGLNLLPANAEMGAAERFLPLRAHYETTLRDLLADGSDRYDYILLDCPPFLGAVTTCALTACNLLVMPTQPEFFSIAALRSMISTIKRVRGNGNPGLAYRLLLTLHDRRNRIHRTLSEQLRSTFGAGLFQTTIDIDTKLRESPIAGQSILTHAPKSRAAAQYRTLAQEIAQYVQETTNQPA